MIQRILTKEMHVLVKALIFVLYCMLILLGGFTLKGYNLAIGPKFTKLVKVFTRQSFCFYGIG